MLSQWQTMLTISVTAVIFQLVWLVRAKGTAPERYGSECRAWSDVITQLQQEQNVRLNCSTNPQCSGIDCLGEYSYTGQLSNYLPTPNATFCFGLLLEPCTSPVALRGYIEMFDDRGKMTTTNFTVQNQTDDLVLIKGTNYTVMGGSTAAAYLDVHANHTTIGRKPHMYLQVVVRVKFRGSLFGYSMERFMESMRVTIIPGMYVPIPPCDRRVPDHFHSTGTCSFTAVDKILPPLTTAGSGKPCQSGKIGQCGDHQICSVHGKCICDNVNAIYDKNTQTCRTPNYTAPVYNTYNGTTGEEDSHGSTNVIIIIASSVAGFLLVAGVVIFVVIRVRRRRARGTQFCLINNENDDIDHDDVEPIDIST